jgi:hypothetical protein
MHGRKSPSLRFAALLAGLLSTFCLSGYQGTASSCTPGSFNDHDDLIFAVN